jgi:hypothetical protein
MFKYSYTIGLPSRSKKRTIADKATTQLEAARGDEIRPVSKDLGDASIAVSCAFLSSYSFDCQTHAWY